MISLKSMALAISLIFTTAPCLADSTPPVINTITDSININLATVQQLASLKGVGEVKAQAIVNYREAHGEFDSLDDLLNVKGIGEKVLADNQTRLSL